MRILLVLALMAFGCGEDKKEDCKGEECNIFTDTLGTLGTPSGDDSPSSPQEGVDEFEGYVQVAFEITVDGVEFNDSEHFYSRFIEDLIIPHHADLAEAQIEVLGEYGHDRFGTNAPIYMAPMATEAGHQFDATTDSNRHFKVNVDKAKEGTEYRAKIILRIGLKVNEELHCYLLHATKENIKFVEGEPIIFNNFTTQLNKWECEEAKIQPIEIPAPTPAPDAAIIAFIVVDSTTKSQILAEFGPPDNTDGNVGPYVYWNYAPKSGYCFIGTGADYCHVRFNKGDGGDTKVESVKNIRLDYLK